MTSPASIPPGRGRPGGGPVARTPPVHMRYVGASAGALGIDLACFLLLLGTRAPAAAASAIGYAAGIGAHWWLSSRTVFADGLAGAGAGRLRQQALFLGSAIVGLGITVGVVGIGTALRFDPRLAKLGAILMSFQAMWLLRRHVVFAR